MIGICIFASGTGTNAENIIRYFRDSEKARVLLVASNNSGAGVIDVAKKFSVETLFLDNELLNNGVALVNELKKRNIDFIVLAGFLRKIPVEVVRFFKNRIINIHPALLPKFGGKGMYGINVHEAVLSDGEKETGISIHHVTENYDEGKIIFQAKCTIDKNDTPLSIEKKVHALEYQYYPSQIEKIISLYES